MIDSKDILSLLSIPSDNILNVSIISDTNDISYVDIELKDIRTNCPFCFSKKIGIKDYYDKHIKNSIIRHHKLIVNVHVRRYVCKKCKRTFKQSFYLSEDHESISYKTKEIAKTMLLDRISMEYIAKELSISKQTVINILDDMPNPSRLVLPNVICIDEFHFSNANTKAGKYPCVISNPFTSDIIDIVESRKKAYLLDYFSKISIQERKNVKYFISDMNDGYRSIHHIFFNQSIHIVDHFHVIKLFTEAIQITRTKIMKTFTKDTKEYKYLKRNWKLFLMNKNKLNELIYVDSNNGTVNKTIDSINMVLKAYPDLNEIYQAKDEFVQAMLHLHGVDETTEYLEFFINKFSRSLLKELNNIAKTFINWKKEIINAYSKNEYGIVLTNAIAESNNNYIQTLINVGYGYSNFNRLRKRILYISSNRKGG